MEGGSSEVDDFSVHVVASDITVEAHSYGIGNYYEDEDEDEEDDDEWHDCDPSLDDLSDLEQLQFLDAQGTDKHGRKILMLTAKFFPAPVIRDERLKRFVHQKLSYTVAEGPFCILYIHTDVQKEENSPGISTLRWIYEDLPLDYKKRLEVVYFLHPGIQSRLVMATLGRFFLSESLYWKIKYISRVEFMWNDIKKGQIELPDFVYKHDTMLENRPLMDYGIEADPYNLHAGPGLDYSFSKFGYR